MRPRRIAAGQSLVLEGDRPDHAFSVISGAVKLYKSLADGRTQITGYLLPGDFLGLPQRGGYAFSAEALSPTALCQFPRAPLQRMFDKHHRLQEHFLALVHDDLAAAQAHMLLLGRKTATERVAAFLVQLLDRTERFGGSTDPLHLPMHRHDIGDHLGLTIETVSRAFSRLRKDQIIALAKSDEVIAIDRDGLEAVAEGIA